MDHSFSHKSDRMTENLLKYSIYLLLFVNIINNASSFGYDSSNSCSPNGKLSRHGRAEILASIPCDLTTQVYCQQPGSSYPWHAVRRFVHENQGLMKRMYGNVRHISILRDEIQNNEIEFEDIEMTADRYSRSGFSRSSKFVNINDPENINTEAHFQPITTTATSEAKFKSSQLNLSEKTSENFSDVNTVPIEFNNTADNSAGMNKENLWFNKTYNPINGEDITETSNYLPTVFNKTDLTEGVADNSKDSVNIPLLNEGIEENIDMNSVFGITTSPQSDVVNGNNIEIVESPILTLSNSSEAVIISTTLKKSQPINSETTHLDLPNSSEDRHTTHKQQSLGEHQDSDSKKVESLNTKSKLNESEQITHSSKVKGFTITSPQKEIQSQIKNKYTSSPTTSKVSKIKIDLPSGVKSQKPTKSSAAFSATATKPVLRDGQLFQDTMKQEQTSVPNMRGVNACPVKEEVVAPFWANNTRGEILALLNLYPFEQYVHWEKCTYEYKQMYCREGCHCEQQYRLHRLLAYDPHNECRGIFSDWFRFPSCCICKCYDVPLDFRATSRSPRAEGFSAYKHPIEIAEENVKKAIYEHATEEWYRPKDEFDLFED